MLRCREVKCQPVSEIGKLGPEPRECDSSDVLKPTPKKVAYPSDKTENWPKQGVLDCALVPAFPLTIQCFVLLFLVLLIPVTWNEKEQYARQCALGRIFPWATYSFLHGLCFVSAPLLQ